MTWKERNDVLEKELFIPDNEVPPEPVSAVPLKTWMYSQEYPEGVLFTVQSPEYKQCVRSGNWYNRPNDRKEGVPAMAPETCYGRHLVDWREEVVEYDDPVAPEVGFSVEVPELEAADGETLKAISFDVEPEPDPPLPVQKPSRRGRRR